MIILYCITGMALLWSFLANSKKTKAGVIIAIKRFGHIIPAIFIMLALVSCLPIQTMVAGVFNISDHVNYAFQVLIPADRSDIPF